jgi:hypothetical protein
MLGLAPWVSLVAALLLVLLARVAVANAGAGAVEGDLFDAPTGAARLADRLRALADSRWAPAVAGAITGAATWYVWASLTRSAVIHDEAAYLLQAELFSHLRFTAPSPPLPQFFEQLYVNLAPAISSKYPPGTSLLIAPGMLIGLPGLPIVLANTLTGALVYAVTRRVIGGAGAALAWALWITSYPVLYYHAMYLSEVPTSLAWLAAWWGVSRWATSGRARDLAITALALAICGITRPLTAVALTLSVGAVLLIVARRRRGTPMLSRREIGTLATAAIAAVAVIGVWSWRSTGSPFVTPLSLYTKHYVPFDRLGFGVRDGDAPAASLPWDQRVTDGAFYEEHRKHTPGSLPVAAVSRARMIGRDMWYDWRGGLAVVALFGLVGAPPVLWVGLGALAVQLLLYLFYAHPARWSLYYIEGLPVLAFVTALGVLRVLELGARRTSSSRARLAVLVTLLVAMAYPTVVTLRQVRAQIVTDHAYYEAFVASLPPEPDSAIVFVRYAPSHNDGLSVVRNVPDIRSERIWTVYDRGAENAQLLRLAPARRPYLFDEASWSLKPLEGLKP